MKTVEEQLKGKILNEYGSIRKFIEKIDMPYSTMNTILKRGVKNANIVNIIKICDKLGISTDDLANGVITRKKTKYEMLSNDEEKLISNYKELNDLGKKEANKRVSELTCIDKYINTDQYTNFSNLCVAEDGPDYLSPKAAHNDDLTEDEKKEMDRRIEELLKKRGYK